MNLTRRLFLGRTGTAAVAMVAPAVTSQAASASPKPHDDGPLLADDATGTNAYALYAAGDPDWRINARASRAAGEGRSACSRA